MNALANQTWGELSPVMRELNELQRAFVREYVSECLNRKARKDGKPGRAGAPYGAAVNAARRAGYGKHSKSETLSKHAHDLTRNPKIIEAIDEESKRHSVCLDRPLSLLRRTSFWILLTATMVARSLA